MGAHPESLPGRWVHLHRFFFTDIDHPEPSSAKSVMIGGTQAQGPCSPGAKSQIRALRSLWWAHQTCLSSGLWDMTRAGQTHRGLHFLSLERALFSFSPLSLHPPSSPVPHTEVLDAQARHHPDELVGNIILWVWKQSIYTD